MPYIKTEKREQFNKPIEELVSGIRTTGELNYVITRLCHRFIQKQCVLCYDLFNSIIGVLGCVKLELYRTVIAPYEHEKRAENGHISPLDIN